MRRDRQTLPDQERLQDKRRELAADFTTPVAAYDRDASGASDCKRLARGRVPALMVGKERGGSRAGFSITHSDYQGALRTFRPQRNLLTRASVLTM